ncbi:MAG: InlB B-repeat-containing protein [Paludibacteraceae bacterium]|nr:InlB B-repeat-containing protein [Paludibacteraceae bacterium]
MKRLSLFFAALFVAAMSFAQTLPNAISFTAEAAKGTLTDSTFEATNLTLQTIDPDGKMSIDSNACSFGIDGTALDAYALRLKTGGKTNNADAPSKNYMKLNASEAGTLLIAVRTGSNSDTTRTLVIKQNGVELFNQAIRESMRDSVVAEGGTSYFYHYVSVEVAAGEIALIYPVNGINFYGFKLVTSVTPVSEGIVYELNGGVTNEEGWMSKLDMYHALNADYNAVTGGTNVWADPDPTNVATGIPTNQPTWDLTFFPNSAKWKWLGDYLDAECAAQGKTLPSTSAAFMRYNLQAFFIEGVRSGWPASADYAIAGTYAAFQPTWQHGFVNPATVTEETALYDPYRAGYTFDGWYATADFSGNRVTSINAQTSGTLYAKWVEYIPKIAEIQVMADSVVTKAQGVVTKVIGSNFWIQDATGGILCYQQNHGVAVGEAVTLSAKKVMYGGIPELMNITVISHEAGEAVTPLALQLADVIAEPDKYMSKLVIFKGVMIHYAGDSVFLKNGNDAIYCFRLSLDQTAMPENTKVNALVIVSSYNGKLQLRANNTGDVVEVGAAGQDPYSYPARGENGEYTLTNDWLISLDLDNYAENAPGAAGFVRSMVEKDGKMYFLNRDDKGNGWFTVVNGANGKMEPERLNITGEHLFQKEVLDTATNTTSWVSATTNPFNHVAIDNAGNVLVGACPLGNADVVDPNRVMIYVVDLATGAATELINENIHAEADYLPIAFRFDAFGVWGDVNAHAVIMAANASYMDVFKWEINNGVAGPGEEIEIAISEDQTSYLAGATSFGISPTIHPVNDEYFYVDGQACYPTMFNSDGNLIDDFKMNTSGNILKIGNNAGDSCNLQVNNNGYAEFQIGDEHFLVMAATCHTGSPAETYALYKFGPNQNFSDMEPLWFFPNAGLGKVAGSSYQATPMVEVTENTAKIYIFQPNDGYGVYTFTGKTASGIKNVDANQVETLKVIENGQVYIIRNGVRYSVLGAQISK